MYTFTILGFLILLACLLVGLLSPKLISRIFKKEVPSRKYILSRIGGATLLVFIFLVILTPSAEEKIEKKSNDSLEVVDKFEKNEEETNSYTVVNKEELVFVENHWIVVESLSNLESNLENLAKQYKEENCKKDCNVSVFDDKRAADLDFQYGKISDPKDLEEWKEKNYVFVADHLLAFLDFNNNFLHFPLKDWFYKELNSR